VDVTIVVLPCPRLQSCFAIYADFIDDLLIFNMVIAEKNISSEIPKNTPFKSIYIDNIHSLFIRKKNYCQL
jgi:hypothetical protein